MTKITKMSVHNIKLYTLSLWSVIIQIVAIKKMLQTKGRKKLTIVKKGGEMI